MKTADLTGGMLAYWFARAKGSRELVKMQGDDCLYAYQIEDLHGVTTQWLAYEPQFMSDEVFGAMSNNDIYAIPLGKSASKGFEKSPRAYEASSGNTRYTGPTLGEAVCKAMIDKVFGDEVPDL
jgi:hypothetical protein